MAKNLASVKPVKVYGMLCGKHLDTNGMDFETPTYSIDCTLLTTARYKNLMAVVNAAKALHAAETVESTAEWYESFKPFEWYEALKPFAAAIEAAEKAGAL